MRSSPDPQPHRKIDCLIVGAGLAGLHCALTLKREHPYWHIVIAEAYGYIGGRVVSYHTKPDVRKALQGLSWENGAGRVHESHRLVGNYVKQFHLTKIPLNSAAEFRHEDTPDAPTPDRWAGLAQWIESFLRPARRQDLASSTIRKLLEKTIGTAKTRAILQQFPYRSETETLRADAGLHSLRTEMGSSDNYYVVAEGLSALINGMVGLCKKGPQPVEFLLHHRLQRFHTPKDGSAAVFLVTSPEASPRLVELNAPRIILALHSSALSKITPFTQWPLLQHVTMKPLLRIYAVFPVNSKGECWFSGLPRTVTNSPIRYFIPINPKRGVAMISYTDGRDVAHWRGAEERPATILNALRVLFPERTIPDPLFLKFHEWTDGCSYWLPLKHPQIDQPTPFQLSRAALRPFPRQYPHVFVCGESFSTRQAWMEGALEHANLLLNTHRAFFTDM